MKVIKNSTISLADAVRKAYYQNKDVNALSVSRLVDTNVEHKKKFCCIFDCFYDMLLLV
jgi:hypothetical protein